MKLPLKPGVTSTTFWATVIGGLLYTALVSLPLLDVAWGAGALVILTIAYKANQNRLEKNKANTAPPEEPGA